MTNVATQPGSVAPRADVSIQVVHSEPDARAAVAVLSEIWPRPDGRDPLPPELAWVFAHSGNYVAIARVDGVDVAAAIGFRASDVAGAHLHSHIAGVLPGWQGSNIGFELKQHQRRWAVEQGLDRITWTFDPLVARNAYFNVMKLGARLTEYYVDFYGPMSDGINFGDETDRCLVTWPAADPRTLAAANGQQQVAEVAALERAGARRALVVDSAGRPCAVDTESDLQLVQLPADIVAMRAERPALAAEWRLALRATLQPAFERGFEIVSVTRDSWYVLSQPGASLG
jgi:predicted GNAT superfamily acetyltransferase